MLVPESSSIMIMDKKEFRQKNTVLRHTAKTHDGNIIIMQNENIFVHMPCQNVDDVWYKTM